MMQYTGEIAVASLTDDGRVIPLQSGAHVQVGVISHDQCVQVLALTQN
jgi:hypothetical protein